MKKIKRILILTIALILSLSIASVIAYAQDNTETAAPDGYDLSLTDGDGNVTYHTADEYSAVFASAMKLSGSTITLLRDMEVSDTVVFEIGSNLTFDLNGHTLTRRNFYGDVYVMDSATGEYVIDTAQAIAESTSAFQIAKAKNSNITFTLTSRNGNATVYNLTQKRDIYKNADGSVAEYKYGDTDQAVLFRQTRPKNVTINISNISIYSASLTYVDDNTTENLSFNVDNCRFYKTAGASSAGKYGFCTIGIFAYKKVTFEISNSLFYDTGFDIFGTGSKTHCKYFIDFSNASAIGSIHFNNCDIIGGATTSQYYSVGELTNIEFENCRVYNLKKASSGKNTLYLKNNTVFDSKIASNAQADEGYGILKKTQPTNTYSLPSSSRFETDENGKLKAFVLEEKPYQATYIVKELATVNWQDADGNVLATTYVTKGDTATPPTDLKLPTGDGWTANLIKTWLNSNGENSYAIGEEDSYVFTASLENSELVSNITDLRFSFAFFTEFYMYFYLPVTEGMEAPVLNVQKLEKTVRINGKEYWCYLEKRTTTNVSDDFALTVSFEKDGKAYTEDFVANALVYADTILSDEKSHAVEKNAVANMVRYIKEARLSCELETSEKFTEIEALYNLDAYKNSADYDSLGADYSAISSYVDSIHFRLDGSVASFVFTLNSKNAADITALTAQYENTGKGISLRSSDETIYVTADTRVYDVIELIRINITLSDGTVLSGTYSLGAYINEMNNSLAMAVLEFGSAAKTYRTYLSSGIIDCEHSYEETERKYATPLVDGHVTYVCKKCSDVKTETLPATKSIKILAIGNSFSIDAMEHLYGILKDAGVEEIKMANLYHSGCSLDRHWTNASGDVADYTLYLSDDTKGAMVSQGSSEDALVTIKYAMDLEDWDIVTMQQASGSSYKSGTFENLDNLINYVQTNEPNARLMWHMTWAYDTYYLETGTTHTDSTNMYNKIVNVVKEIIIPRGVYAKILPSGTAIENIRTSSAGPVLTRDGYHLSYDIGRYTAALTWFAAICETGVEDIDWVPTKYADTITENLTVIKEAVTNAIANPYTVTESLYPPVATDPEEPENPETPVEPEDPETPSGTTGEVTDLTEEDIAFLTANGYDAAKYKRLVLEMQDDSFYNSTSSSTKNTTNTLKESFASTKIFDRAELINGSLIRFTKTDANGNTYQYRPEGWVALDQNNSSADRPDTVKVDTFETVDDEWWGSFNYRAFNIQRSGITLEEAESVFVIYVPV